MRIIIFVVLILVIANPVHSHTPQTTSNLRMQSQMKQVINELNKQIPDTEKQLAEVKKNKKDASVIKDLEDQLTMLK